MLLLWMFEECLLVFLFANCLFVFLFANCYFFTFFFVCVCIALSGLYHIVKLLHVGSVL